MEFNSSRDKEITLKKIQKIPERLLLEELLTSSIVKKKKSTPNKCHRKLHKIFVIK